MTTSADLETVVHTGQNPELTPEERVQVDAFLDHEEDFDREYFLDLKQTWKVATLMGPRLLRLPMNKMLKSKKLANLQQFLYRAHPLVVNQMVDSLQRHFPTFSKVLSGPGLTEMIYGLVPRARPFWDTEFPMTSQERGSLLREWKSVPYGERDSWLRNHGFIE